MRAASSIPIFSLVASPRTSACRTVQEIFRLPQSCFTKSASCLDSSLRPWSTLRACRVSPIRGASRCSTRASAVESAPPESASNSREPRASPSRVRQNRSTSRQRRAAAGDRFCSVGGDSVMVCLRQKGVGRKVRAEDQPGEMQAWATRSALLRTALRCSAVRRPKAVSL